MTGVLGACIQVYENYLRGGISNALRANGISLYGTLNSENERERRFHDFLEMVGYTVKHKKIKFIKDVNDIKQGGHHKGNMDVDLAIDAVDLKNEYESFVLLSSDGDFEPLLKYLKVHKKRCIVMSTKGHVSIELIRQAKFISKN